MKPTEELVHEHEVITHVLKSVAVHAGRMIDTAVIQPELIEMLLDFSRNFVDLCHHAKEEKHLFPMLESRGMSHESGPIAVMLMEHAAGRKRLSAIASLLPAARLGDKDAIRSIAENLGAYAELLENHIAKENKVLFPMADRVLSGADQGRLQEAFARVEEIETGQGVHEKYHQLAHTISEFS
jgi:hemerythrin-like domain-containing protein